MSKLTDNRKAKGKVYRLETGLIIVILAKLCGEDRPLGIAQWAQHLQDMNIILQIAGRYQFDT